MSAAWLLTVALLHPVWTQDSPLAELYAQGQLDEVVSLAGERLERDPADQDALYWCGRAELDRARALLASRGQRASRTGLDLALDLADAQLERAAGQLGRVLPADRGPRADARQWHWFARSLRTADDTLAPELERAWSDEGSAYAAYLRGLRELDTDPAAAEAWLRRAGEAAPERADIQLAWAEALARTGKRQAALDAWDRARIARATRAELCSALLGLMPTPDGAATRLERLEQLAADADGASDALLAWHRAHALEQLGRLPEAEAALAAATDGLTPQIIGVRARLLAALNRPLEAQMLLVPPAAAGDRGALEQLVGLGDELARRRDYQAALAAYDAALAIAPEHARAAANRALTLARSGGGVEAYRELAASHGERADLLNDAALALWGWGRPEEARALLERAAALPAGHDARENLAAMLLEQRPPDSTTARPLLEKVLADEPERDRALFLWHVLATVRSR